METSQVSKPEIGRSPGVKNKWQKGDCSGPKERRTKKGRNEKYAILSKEGFKSLFPFSSHFFSLSMSMVDLKKHIDIQDCVWRPTQTVIFNSLLFLLNLIIN